MPQELVVVTKEAGVATVRLNVPDSMNALSVAMGHHLGTALTELSTDPDIRVLVLTGTGRGFCAGGDVQSFYDHRDDPHDVMQRVIDALHAAVETLLGLPFPTIAAINGVVAGAGMGLALATDLAVASDKAVFTMAYTGIGVSPDGSSTFFLPRIVGTRLAMELILTNRVLTADEALTLGLVNQLAPSDSLGDAVGALATQLADGPTLAYVRSRQLIRSAHGNTPTEQMSAEAASILAAGSTHDFYEGVSAFIEKRRPTFTGK